MIAVRYPGLSDAVRKRMWDGTYCNTLLATSLSAGLFFKYSSSSIVVSILPPLKSVGRNSIVGESRPQCLSYVRNRTSPGWM